MGGLLSKTERAKSDEKGIKQDSSSVPLHRANNL